MKALTRLVLICLASSACAPAANWAADPGFNNVQENAEAIQRGIDAATFNFEGEGLRAPLVMVSKPGYGERWPPEFTKPIKSMSADVVQKTSATFVRSIRELHFEINKKDSIKLTVPLDPSSKLSASLSGASRRQTSQTTDTSSYFIERFYLKRLYELRFNMTSIKCSPEFVDLLSTSSDRTYTANAQTYASIVDKFGTHFVSSATIGGRLHKTMQLSAKSYIKVLNITSDAVATELAMEVFGGKASVATDQSILRRELFNELKSSSSISCLATGGTAGNACDNIREWDLTVDANPKPVEFTLHSIHRLPCLDTTQRNALKNAVEKRLVDGRLQQLTEYIKAHKNLLDSDWLDEVNPQIKEQVDALLGDIAKCLESFNVSKSCQMKIKLTENVVAIQDISQVAAEMKWLLSQESKINETFECQSNIRRRCSTARLHEEAYRVESKARIKSALLKRILRSAVLLAQQGATSTEATFHFAMASIFEQVSEFHQVADAVLNSRLPFDCGLSCRLDCQIFFSVPSQCQLLHDEVVGVHPVWYCLILASLGIISVGLRIGWHRLKAYIPWLKIKKKKSDEPVYRRLKKTDEEVRVKDWTILGFPCFGEREIVKKAVENVSNEPTQSGKQTDSLVINMTAPTSTPTPTPPPSPSPTRSKQPAAPARGARPKLTRRNTVDVITPRPAN